jgi:proline iminopeptidase
MLPLYPELKPYARHRFKVSDAHELYVDESGNKEGIPVLFVHAGPGSGCEFDSRRFFSPDKYRIILFDQRGAGRSLPPGDISANTPEHLLADMEQIRAELGVDKWVLFGGGWGSTLSLLYAEAFPENVLSLILRGIFLARQKDIDWIYHEGTNRFCPDHWQDFVAPLAASDHDQVCDAFQALMLADNELARMSAAKAWSIWEAQCATLHPNQRLIKHYSNPHRSMARCNIGSYYYSNGCFLEENQILRDAAKLKDVPGIIIHGRFDLLCPFENAHLLHQAWPESQLYIVREAGHAATEPALIDALIRATRTIANRHEREFGV